MKKLIRPILTAMITLMASPVIFAGTSYVPHVGGTGLNVRLLHELTGQLLFVAIFVLRGLRF